MIGATPSTGLSTAGAIFMALAWTGILSLAVFCFYRIFKSSRRKR
jgi:hypothetical protein